MESFSIDEVFLDMSGPSYIYPDPVATAHELKDKIRTELGFTVNIGISTNKLLAKMASDFEKPDKVHTLFPEEIPVKMWPLPVRELLFLGRSSEKKLQDAGIRTIGDLAHEKKAKIQALLGEKAGQQLYQYARGLDDSPVKAKPDEAKGFSLETTFNDDLVSLEQALPILLEQCDIPVSYTHLLKPEVLECFRNMLPSWDWSRKPGLKFPKLLRRFLTKTPSLPILDRVPMRLRPASLHVMRQRSPLPVRSISFPFWTV